MKPYPLKLSRSSKITRQDGMQKGRKIALVDWPPMLPWKEPEDKDKQMLRMSQAIDWLAC